MSCWPPTAQIPRMLACNLVSICVINEHDLHIVQGAYRQLRRFCFIKSNLWCAATSVVGDKCLSLSILLKWISFSAIVCAVIAEIWNDLWRTQQQSLFHWLNVPITTAISPVRLKLLFWLYLCMLDSLSVAFPQRAELILCYWLTRSCFAPSHKTSL